MFKDFFIIIILIITYFYNLLLLKYALNNNSGNYHIKYKIMQKLNTNQYKSIPKAKLTKKILFIDENNCCVFTKSTYFIEKETFADKYV
jgi:hypothetical protein